MQRTLLCVLTLALVAAFGGASTPAMAAGSGEVEVEWTKVKKSNREAARWLKKSKAVEAVVDEVNERYDLPHDIPIVLGDELDIGPAYLPDVELDDGSRLSFINFPGWFMTLSLKEIRRELRGVRGVGPKSATAHATQFVVAHEIGHALVDQLDLPVTGKEEDAVDGFAAYLLTGDPRFGPAVPLSAALFFDAISDQPRAEDYADEHSLAQQRVYQFLCWTYGSDRKAFKDLVGRDGLPKRRAVRCADEFKQVERSWSRLLEPYAAARP